MEPRKGMNIDSRAPVADVASRGRAVTLVGSSGPSGKYETETAPAWPQVLI